MPSEHAAEIGKRMQQAREKALPPLTLAQCAQALNVSYHTYRNWETGISDAPSHVLLALADLTGSDLRGLISGESPVSKPATAPLVRERTPSYGDSRESPVDNAAELRKIIREEIHDVAREILEAWASAKPKPKK